MLLQLAYLLSLIGYYLGLVLYAAPLPVNVKRFGLRMAYHGAASALLVLLYSTIVYATESLFHVLGVSWSDVGRLYDRMSLTAASYYGVAAGLKLASSELKRLIGNSDIYKLLSVAINTVSSNFVRASILISVSEAVVQLVASLVYNYWQFLLALGILFYAIPGGLGKRAGASLIASAIVLYLGIPFLPVWSNMWLSSVSRVSLPVALFAGGGGGESYIVWGHVLDYLNLSNADVFHVVFWKGGVPLAAESNGIFVLMRPLPPGYYEVSLYLADREVDRLMVNIPEGCRNEPLPSVSIIGALTLFLESIGYGNAKQCELLLHSARILAVGYNLALYWDPGIELENITLYAPGNATFAAWFKGNGLLHVCSCCECDHLNVKVEGEAGIKNNVSKEGVQCSNIMVQGYAYVYVHGAGCKAGFDKVGPSFSPYQPLLTIILHDLPLAAYMVAMAYSAAVWSFLALMMLLIYGFGRILGESPSFFIKIRY